MWQGQAWWEGKKQDRSLSSSGNEGRQINEQETHGLVKQVLLNVLKKKNT